MPEVSAQRSVARPLDDIWRFVEDLDAWAPLVRGYRTHAQLDDRRSRWTLAGELGPFSREVELDVQITEWEEARRVAFTMTGITEVVQASGAFDLSETRPPAVLRPWWRRLLDWFTGRRAPAEAGEGIASHVTFTFSIAAGGPMGPLVDPMLGPYAALVAQDLLDAVGHRLEAP